MRRDFPAAKINQKWYGDGTEIQTAEGKPHLASVLDVASRRVLGFALSGHHDAQLACGALEMAAAVRGGQVAGVIMHTDQGAEPRFKGSSLDKTLASYCTSWCCCGVNSVGELVAWRLTSRGSAGSGDSKSGMFLSLPLWAVSSPARRQALMVEGWTPRRPTIWGG